jgi:hypothetical protein
MAGGFNDFGSSQYDVWRGSGSKNGDYEAFGFSSSPTWGISQWLCRVDLGLGDVITHSSTSHRIACSLWGSARRYGIRCVASEGRS